jgi:plastocyanin
MKKLLLLPLLVFVLAAAAPAGAYDTYTSAITAAGFIPANQTVQNGDAVTWTNNTTSNHQIVADDGSFASDVLTPGESYTHIFVNEGAYAYHDGTAPSDKGTVTVKLMRVVFIKRVRAEKIRYTRSTTLRGSVSQIGGPSSNGEEVLVQAKPYGDTDFTTVVRTTTKNGQWRAVVRPRVNTVYRAVWNNVPSGERTLSVKPLMKLVPATAGKLALRVDAGVSLRGHRVTLQRRTRHGWVAFRSVRLARLKASRTTYSVRATFRLRLAPGNVVRARMTHRQAGPAMYGPALSNSLRIHH